MEKRKIGNKSKTSCLCFLIGQLQYEECWSHIPLNLKLGSQACKFHLLSTISSSFWLGDLLELCNICPLKHILPEGICMGGGSSSTEMPTPPQCLNISPHLPAHHLTVLYLPQSELCYRLIISAVPSNNKLQVHFTSFCSLFILNILISVWYVDNKQYNYLVA